MNARRLRRVVVACAALGHSMFAQAAATAAGP
jgi:hypothetical protein